MLVNVQGEHRIHIPSPRGDTVTGSALWEGTGETGLSSTVSTWGTLYIESGGGGIGECAMTGAT
jgi:hypothetical protein